MAQDIPRTVSTDVSDALAQLDAAEREIANWRAHLTYLAETPDGAVGIARQARRCGGIVAAAVEQAGTHTRNAQSRALREAPAADVSRSVS